MNDYQLSQPNVYWKNISLKPTIMFYSTQEISTWKFDLL